MAAQKKAKAAPKTPPTKPLERLYKTRFIKLRTKSGGSNTAFARDRAGVYLIQYNGGLPEENNYHNLTKEDEGKVVYIGMSDTQLEKTALRHFYRWDDDTQYRASLAHGKDDPAIECFTIRFILVKNTTQVSIKQEDGSYKKIMATNALEAGLIIKHKPKLNETKYQYAYHIYNGKLKMLKTAEEVYHPLRKAEQEAINKWLDEEFTSTPKPIPSDDEVPF
ncbi:MAG: hypothetical protein EBX41_00860 [Chitinophagia bacterium]|nr:hypothetical protein [Chitinophagia bacterium]